MRYRCDICETVFDEPRVVKRQERLNGFLYSDETAMCPICATPYFSEVEDCTCGGVRERNKPLCKECRSNLLKRITGLFDELTAEEEEQFDDWMDGDSITSRKRWR